MNWDLFIGPAAMRPFHEIYTPWNWRGWWDFGTGAFGDMACHVLDPVYQSLKLGYPDARTRPFYPDQYGIRSSIGGGRIPLPGS